MDNHTDQPDPTNEPDPTPAEEPTPEPTTSAEQPEQPEQSEQAAEPKKATTRRPRRKRPNGRWTNPASPLQAARFARRLGGLDVVAGIRQICPGHGGEPCKIDVAKLSDYETRNRRMGIDHIEAFCRFYMRSPEQLGLIKWRDEPTGDADAAAHHGDADRPQFVLVWVHNGLDRQVAATAAQVLRVLSQQATPATGDDSPQDDPGDATG